jgi:hypothetical protein
MDPETLAERLARIETKLDQVLRMVPEHEQRIDELESWKLRAMMCVSIAAAVWGPVCALAVQHLSRRF